jgi:hypothetical protein
MVKKIFICKQYNSLREKIYVIYVCTYLAISLYYCSQTFYFIFFSTIFLLLVLAAKHKKLYEIRYCIIHKNVTGMKKKKKLLAINFVICGMEMKEKSFFYPVFFFCVKFT